MSKEEFIHFRINPKKKREWEKFSAKNKFGSLSQFIRYAVDDHIEKSSKVDKNVIKNNVKDDKLTMLNEYIQYSEKERAKYMEKINEILSSFQQAKEISRIHDLKDKILTLLEKHEYKSEEIADIYKIAEVDVIIVLNSLKKQGLIKLNKSMQYELVNELK